MFQLRKMVFVCTLLIGLTAFGSEIVDREYQFNLDNLVNHLERDQFDGTWSAYVPLYQVNPGDVLLSQSIDNAELNYFGSGISARFGIDVGGYYVWIADETSSYSKAVTQGEALRTLNRAFMEFDLENKVVVGHVLLSK